VAQSNRWRAYIDNGIRGLGDNGVSRMASLERLLASAADWDASIDDMATAT
jgi:hypothetical protein